MNLNFSLDLKLEQKLVMTQEMQLAVKVLQLPNNELKEYIEDELLENPVLELDTNFENKFDKVIEIYSDYDEEYYTDYSEDNEEEKISPFYFISNTKSLYDYLKEQLGYIPLTKRDRKIAEYIIDNLDENGYLHLHDLSIANKFGVSLEVVKNLISIIQDFEPSGICARSLQECLKIQLKAKGIYDSIYEKLIDNELENIANKSYDYISNKYNIPLEKLLRYIEVIKSLDPKPGCRLGNEDIRYIIPDVYVEKVNGEYVVRVNDDNLPMLKINKHYKSLLRNKNSEEYKYIKSKIEAAYWLIKSIEQRRETIKKVAEVIVKHQIGFFENDEYLKPLNLKTISEETGLHESTVSRAINGKYAQTPKGVFELKYFLVRGLNTSFGENVSVDILKDKILEIINSENKRKPYSDQQIADILNASGVKISRRTVTKYREEMGIESSSKRKIK
ncbi:RNA polymerase factor sigma-54 [Thermobrachium celere]|uniref:RNA polymerase sigma-54 factor RpoN n=1 Tax=Thermobrachium celere DSM 8682 TaxID=941824 RepID=R7RTP0_9CLOT|nr:RNA polymerase factor sigma-54 [Thermobrachium celere]CDF58658.1 RNA polymerase sigma-54 factor RpoN [Thermobrachium celere DSM 8682]